MIEGLKVTVQGTELKQLAEARVAHHEERARVYTEQIVNFKAASVEPIANMTNGDPVAQLEQRRASHASEADELRFIAAHIDTTEDYLLERDALFRLGIVSRNY